MKKLLTAIIALILIFALGLGACAYGGEAPAPFQFGPESRESQPQTVGEFIPVFADQLKRYNKAALEIWPDNAISNITFVIDDIDTGRMWLIGPDGQVSPLSEEEAAEMKIERFDMPFIWNPFGDFYEYDENGVPFSLSFEGKTLDGGGIYFSVSEESLNDIGRWGKWSHVSTYDVLRFGLHEAFHLFEQQKWQKKEEAEIVNYETKDQFFNETEARIKRDLLIKQVMAAAAGQGDKRLVLDALATYEDYKKQFPEDFKNALYWDRSEGTANYFEYVLSIYSYFPDQVRNKKDAARALAQLAAIDMYRLITCGVIDEGYELGAFTGILLDQLGIDWKTQLMNDPELTPLEILSLHFIGEELPEPVQPAQAEIDEALDKLRERKAGIAASLEESVSYYETALETAAEEEREWIKDMIEDLRDRIIELSE